MLIAGAAGIGIVVAELAIGVIPPAFEVVGIEDGTGEHIPY